MRLFCVRNQLTRRLYQVLLAVLVPAALSLPCFAIGQPQHVRTTPAPGSFPLARTGVAAKLYVDPGDWPGILRAAHDLQADIQRVTGIRPDFSREAKLPSGDVVLIGTIGKSGVIDRLIREHKIDVSDIRGKWESTLTQVVDHPLPRASHGRW